MYFTSTNSSMSSGIEEQPLVVQPEDQIVSKKPMRSYTREFLLSLSDLEVCRKLPDGFDDSLLSKFDDTTHGIYDRQRTLGSSSLQGFRRSDYGSSAPGRGDSGSYSRGLHRWDSRSSGRSDTDTDSESGRCYGSQTRKSGQNSEHDGLLGSGSFPRPSGYAAGAAVPRFRPNNFYLNKSNEPYHPPRPYKAAPHARRETNDSYNDETFGSTDSTSEDRAEEEKKRRAEFELMRKEQQKALQEKQKSNSGKLDDPFSDITGLLGNPVDISSDPDKLSKQAPQDDFNKLRVTSSAPPSRPLVPPGFVNSVVDKSSTSKSLVHGDQAEVGKTEFEESHRDLESVAKERGLSELQCETSGSSILMSEKTPVLQAAEQAKTSDLSDVREILENGDIVGLDSEVTGHKLLGEPGRSTSILEKLFGNAMTRDSGGTSNLVEDHDTKTDGIWSPNSLQSKFASWFLEEDKNQNIANSSSIHANKKPVEEISPGKPNVLLSLIVGGEKGGSDVSDDTTMGQMFPPETRLGHMTFKSASSTAEISEQFSSSNALEPNLAVLTCEDLEQSILSGIGGNSSNSQLNGQESHVLNMKSEHPSAGIDNQASQHLLSLLQGGSESKGVTLFSEKGSPCKPCDQEVGEINATDDNICRGDIEGLNNSGKTLTLEALFGTAFMKELHSAQRNSVVSAGTDVPEPSGLSFLTSDHALFPSAMNEVVNGIGGNDGSNVASNDGIGKFHKAGQWSGFQGPGKEVEFSKPPAEVDSNFGHFDGGVDLRLPEEDNLISLGDPINAQNSVLIPDSDSFGTDLLSSSSNAPVNVIDKLATLGAALKGERSMVGRQDPMLVSGPHDMVKPELPYQNLHRQATSPLLHAPQMNHGKLLFHPLDSHSADLDPHLKFMPPDAIIHHDVPMHYQFPGNMGQPPLHHSGGLPGFDHSIPPILQQMHIAGNLPPPHLERGFPAGAPMPPHPNHNPSGYAHEHNPMQGFPFGQRQLNFGGPGIAPPGPETNNPPEAFHRLLEMELRANPKQMIPPFAGGGHSRAMYGHELDMGFRYR